MSDLPMIGVSKSGPPEGGGVVIVAVDIPAHYAERLRAQRLVPQEIVFVQVAGDLVAGRPVSLPVRELSPMDVVVMMQRAIQGGRIVPAVVFQVAASDSPPAQPV
jgi:hydrogenase/urease accessory protein HupE